MPESTLTDADLAAALDVFMSERARLFHIAYQVVRDVSAAEDVVQEAWVRWQRTDRSTINNPIAFLTTTTSRLAINVIQSAWSRHEALMDAPCADLRDQAADPAQDPALRAELAELAEEALAVLMARLNSAELAAYVLRKGFDYAYDDVAGLIRTSAPNARQLVRRAQMRLQAADRRSVPASERRLMASAFTVASRSGGLAGLEHLLTCDEDRHAA